MDITITNENDLITIKIDGRLDTLNSAEFETAVSSIFTRDVKNIQIDCANLDYISSSGLRIFLKVQKEVVSQKGELTLMGMKPEIKDVFDMTGFSSIFNIK